MREILFRGKRIDNGKWVYGDLNQFQDSCFIHSMESGCRTAHLVDYTTIGQFTGLCDKNGVKIFEGDILLIGDSPKPVLVEFINFSWECTNKNIGPYYRHRLEDNSQKYEIVGNVHDNPDLLTCRDNG